MSTSGSLWTSFGRPFFLFLIALWSVVRLTILWLRHRAEKQRAGKFTVGFFHPFCNSGGGGERVLWQYVRTLQRVEPTIRIVIYTGDTEPAEEILKRAEDRFNLPPIAPSVEFVRLRWRRLVTAEQWPRFTMFGQSLGSVLLALESLYLCACDVFVDTTGFAFTYPVARYLFQAQVHSYTHYPTISSDMLALVFARRENYNNSAGITSNPVLARAKWIYYRMFAIAYGMAGRAVHLVFVNSTWTRDHIQSIWRVPRRTRIVFPPCDTTSLQQLPFGRIDTVKGLEGAASPAGIDEATVRENLVISIAQFRPEKDHALQLRAFALFQQRLRDYERACPARVPQTVRLVVIGGARDEGDRQRVEDLRRLAVELDIADTVDFAVNVPFAELKSYLARATAGLHTMWNEHFGIGVVELMAAGVIPIAHNSGGPRSDILASLADGTRPGYLASTADEYASALIEIFSSERRGGVAMDAMRVAARKRAGDFGDEVFASALEAHFVPFVRAHKAELEKPPPNEENNGPLTGLMK